MCNDELSRHYEKDGMKAKLIFFDYFRALNKAGELQQE